MTTIFQNRRFIAWATGLAIDRLGNAMYMVVLPLMVYHMTSSLKSMAIITACQFIPRVFPGIYVGSIVDISSKRRIFFFALIFQFAIGVLTAILYSLDALPFLLLCVFAAATSVGFEVYRTTEMTLIPIMFTDQRIEATTILASIHTAMLMGGPLLGAVLIKYFSYSILLILNAITYLAPLLASIWSKIPDINSTELKAHSARTKLTLTHNALREALSTVYQSKPLRLLLLFIICVTLATGGLELLIIFYIKNQLNLSDRFASVMFAVGAAGMFTGSLLVTLLKRLVRKKFLLIVLITTGTGIWFLQSATLTTLIIGQFLTFVGIFACSVTQDLMIQESAPTAMLGRISGLLRIVNSATIAASTFCLTWLASLLSFPFIALIVIVIMFVALALSQNPHFSATHYKHSENLNE
ncbi:putative membrane protein [Xenorhabdus poinarii G6]|uniref:Putative membrane protein n=1 Tax=Xenorhabdus poinarii G6 TaxID=1354304 RepID=A0A068R5X0_9GAMM|nr:MFS transporter [Xenorhabdus poinarii]CDG21525.1 putative membrane protein [Xenorhabdus poinarii G6]